MKYKTWILKETKLDPLSDMNITTDQGEKTLRKVNYVYECPYCHQTITCSLSNKLPIRKCRYCNHPVSPYQGEIVEEIWQSIVPENEPRKSSENPCGISQ